MQEQYNVVDLFADAGGMSLGFSKAGITPVEAIEKDRFAAETFRFNFPDVPLFNSVDRHLNAIWWNPDDAVEHGKIINRPL